MNIIIYGKKTEQMTANDVEKIITICQHYAEKVFVFRHFFCDFFEQNNNIVQNIMLIDSIEEIDSVDFLISIGGDGTFLNAADFVGQKPIALLGINRGRLGFLSNLQMENLENIFLSLVQKKYTLEYRMLLEMNTLNAITLGNNAFALNDICFHRTDDSDMIMVDVDVDGKHLNTYWGDGLIVSTPTGSTAYSLSCGGPIINPNLEVFLLSPIASHALTVRPIIVPATNLTIKVKSRTQEFLLSKDSDTKKVTDNNIFTIKKAAFSLKMVQFNNQNFYKTISEKLMWGVDKRISFL